MKKNYLFAVLLGGGVLAFMWWNNERIKTLQKQLQFAQTNPPARSDQNSWMNILRIMLDLGIDVYSQFASGGQFSGKLDQDTIGELLRRINTVPFKP